jgi:hypothetical protein
VACVKALLKYSPKATEKKNEKKKYREPGLRFEKAVFSRIKYRFKIYVAIGTRI